MSRQHRRPPTAAHVRMTPPPTGTGGPTPAPRAAPIRDRALVMTDSPQDVTDSDPREAAPGDAADSGSAGLPDATAVPTDAPPAPAEEHPDDAAAGPAD